MRQIDKPLELYYVVHRYVLIQAPPGWLSWNHSYLIVKKLFYIWNKYMYMYKGTLYCNYQSLHFFIDTFFERSLNFYLWLIPQYFIQVKLYLYIMCSYTVVPGLNLCLFSYSFLNQYKYLSVKKNKNGYKKRFLVLLFILVNENCFDTETIVHIKIWLICIFVILDSYCLECC